MDKINFERLLELKHKIKIAIVGSRDFIDFEQFKEKVDPIFLKLKGQIDCIVSGGAKGADSLAEEYAKANKINTVIYKPDWKKYGRGAGIVRNRVIIENSDLVIAFLKNNSQGTSNSIKVAKELKKELIVFELISIKYHQKLLNVFSKVELDEIIEFSFYSVDENGFVNEFFVWTDKITAEILIEGEKVIIGDLNPDIFGGNIDKSTFWEMFKGSKPVEYYSITVDE